MLNWAYVAVGATVLGLYGLAAFRGWEVGGRGRETAQQATARHQAGGHRGVWVSGYRGGK